LKKQNKKVLKAIENNKLQYHDVLLLVLLTSRRLGTAGFASDKNVHKSKSLLFHLNVWQPI
jgi:hypothetical protein